MSNNNQKNWLNKKDHQPPKPIKEEYFKETYDSLLNLENDKDLDKTFDSISKFVKEKGSAITTTQLRNIYGKIVKAETFQSLKMIRPNLAYIAAREKKAKNIVMFFEELIKGVDSEIKLKSFKKTMEAVVAYHKFHHTK